MKCDKLEAEQWLDYSGEPNRCYPADKVDAAIAELKAEHHKERDEYISMVYSREQTIKELKAENESLKVLNERLMYWPHTDNSAVIANLQEENERLKAELQKQKDAYCRLDAMYQIDTGIACKVFGQGSVNCKALRATLRALWLARAERASCKWLSMIMHIGIYGNWIKKWQKVEQLCRAKAEEYR